MNIFLVLKIPTVTSLTLVHDITFEVNVKKWGAQVQNLSVGSVELDN